MKEMSRKEKLRLAKKECANYINECCIEKRGNDDKCIYSDKSQITQCSYFNTIVRTLSKI